MRGGAGFDPETGLLYLRTTEGVTVVAALGEHLTQRFLEAKRNEVMEYNRQVSRWEIEKYLGRY